MNIGRVNFHTSSSFCLALYGHAPVAFGDLLLIKDSSISLSLLFGQYSTDRKATVNFLSTVYEWLLLVPRSTHLTIFLLLVRISSYSDSLNQTLSNVSSQDFYTLTKVFSLKSIVFQLFNGSGCPERFASISSPRGMLTFRGATFCLSEDLRGTFSSKSRYQGLHSSTWHCRHLVS